METTRAIALQHDLRRRLQSIYGSRLQRAWLFGSYARGEAHSESDLDVMIVLAAPVDRYEEAVRLGDLAVDFLEQYGILIAPVIVSEQEFQDCEWPLLRNVHEEGVAL